GRLFRPRRAFAAGDAGHVPAQREVRGRDPAPSALRDPDGRGTGTRRGAGERSGSPAADDHPPPGAGALPPGGPRSPATAPTSRPMRGRGSAAPHLRRLGAVDGARLRLVCFPYAGGGISIFRAWPSALPAGIEVCSIELPGRDTRIAHPPLTSLPALVQEVRSTFDTLLDAPFTLFGHSMGALLAFELTRSLRRDGLPLPAALFVSGHRAPHLP